MGESFNYVYDWTTECDLKKRKSIKGNGIEFKTTATKDVEIKSKKLVKEGENINEVDNSFNKVNLINNNKSNQMSMKEEENEIIKMDDNNIVNDKVDSRCCIM